MKDRQKEIRAFIPEKGVAKVEDDARRIQYTMVTRNAGVGVCRSVIYEL